MWSEATLETGTVLCQRYVWSVGLSVPANRRFVHVFLKLPPIKCAALLKSLEVLLVQLRPTAAYPS